jgi:hypothetical protein
MPIIKQKPGTKEQLNQVFDKPFIIISFVFFASFWFFSFWTLKNHGVYWSDPFGISHHPYDMSLLNTDFFQSITYIFTQSPFYTIETWLMMKTDPQAGGFLGFLILHYIMGFFAIFSLYKIVSYFNVNKALITIAFCYFVFNPGFYRVFTSGWYDYLSMCLVSIMAYCFLRMIDRFSKKNACIFFLSIMILVLYRSIFNPLYFLLPISIFLLFIYRDRLRSILPFALVALMITLAPFIKNYIIFGSFSIGVGQLATAFKSTTYQYNSPEMVLNDVKKGVLSPLVLCYNDAKIRPEYKGLVYSPKNCNDYIFLQYGTKGAKKILEKRSYLAYPAILQNEHNHFDGDYMPNSLAGFVVGQQLMNDAKSFVIHHPNNYLHSILNNIRQLLRSNNKYEVLLGNNSRKYPDWFAGSWIFNYDIFKLTKPLTSSGVNEDYSPFIVIGMFGSLIYALLFAGNLKRKDLFSFIHFAGLFIILVPVMFPAAFHIFRKLDQRLNWYLCASLLWSCVFMIPGLYYTFKTNLKKMLGNDKVVKQRIIVAFMVLVSFYFLILIDIIPGSEQERYRFTIEGLLVSLFLFWISNLYHTIRAYFSNRVMHVPNDGGNE